MQKLNKYQYLKEKNNKYQIIYPMKDEEGKVITRNVIIGNPFVFFQTIVLIIILLFLSWSYYHDTQACRDYIAKQNPYNVTIVNFSDYGINNTFVYPSVANISVQK